MLSSAEAEQLSFGKFTVEYVFSGQTSLPDFSGRDRRFSLYRTRLIDGLRQGPNFAGHFSVIQFGCGTQCTVAFIANNKTGRVHEFPRGGEDNLELQLAFQLDSRLLIAQWISRSGETFAESRCVVEYFAWENGQAVLLNTIYVGPLEACRSRSASDPVVSRGPPTLEEPLPESADKMEHGQCVLAVGGSTYIDGDCNVTMSADGSFQIYSSDSSPTHHFAFVNVASSGKAAGYWNGIEQSSHAHEPLGMLERDEGCWNNDHATVCAWRSDTRPAAAHSSASLLPRPQRISCFTRAYTQAHLAKHPDQLVTSMSLGLRSNVVNGRYYDVAIAVTIRGKDGIFVTGDSQACHESAKGRISCGITCDQGGFAITPSSRKSSIRLELDRLFFGSACDADAWNGFELTPGLDDKVFRLDATDSDRCEAMFANF